MPWRGGQVALGIALVLVLFVPVTRLAMLLEPLVGAEYSAAWVTWASVHLIGLVILATVWFLGLRWYRAPVSSLGLTRPAVPWAGAVALAVVALGASLGATVAHTTLVDLLGFDFLSPPEVAPDISFTGPAVVLTFEALSVVTPLTEEVFFRGFVLTGLVPRLGVGWATVASGLIFSVFHVSPGVLVPIFITGLLLAWLYRRTGSLWPCILAHAGQNTAALLSTVA